jgi:hypothetical protein
MSIQTLSRIGFDVNHDWDECCIVVAEYDYSVAAVVHKDLGVGPVEGEDKFG